MTTVKIKMYHGASIAVESNFREVATGGQGGYNGWAVVRLELLLAFGHDRVVQRGEWRD